MISARVFLDIEASMVEIAGFFFFLQSCSLRSNFVIYELLSVQVIWMMKIRRLDPYSRPRERPKLIRCHGVVLPLNNFS